MCNGAACTTKKLQGRTRKTTVPVESDTRLEKQQPPQKKEQPPRKKTQQKKEKETQVEGAGLAFVVELALDLRSVHLRTRIFLANEGRVDASSPLPLAAQPTRLVLPLLFGGLSLLSLEVP